MPRPSTAGAPKTFTRASGTSRETVAEPGRNRVGAERRVAALVERLEGKERGAEVRVDSIEDERPAPVGDRVGDAGRLQGDLLDLLDNLDRAFQR